MAVELGSPGAGSPCAECGTVNPPSARFCGDCGHRLGPTRAPAEAVVGAGAEASAPRTVVQAEPGGGPPVEGPRRGGTRRPVWVLVTVVAVVVAGVVVTQRGADPEDTIVGSSRGDAANRGVYPGLPATSLPQDVAWRDTWTSAAPDRQLAPRRPTAVGLGYLVATTGGVAMLDRSNGGVRWRAELPVSGRVDPLPLDDRAVVVAGTGEVSRLDAVEGVRTWRARVPGLGEPQALAATEDTLAVAAGDGTLVLLDVTEGAVRSSVSTTDLGVDPPATVDALAVVAGRFVAAVRPVGGGEARLAAIATDGVVSWVSDQRVIGSLPLLGGRTGTVIGHASDGVVGIDADTGEVRWRWPHSAEEGPGDLAAVAVTPDGSRVLLASRTGVRRTLGTAFGNLVGLARGAALPVRRVGPVDAGGRVAVVTASGDVEVVDVGSGQAVATSPTTDLGLTVPLVDGDRVVAGLAGGRVVARSVGPTGSSWRAVVSPAATCGATAAGAAVLVADRGTLRVHEAGSGSRRWDVRPDGGTGERPPVAGGGVVVTASPTGRVTAVVADDGQIRWVTPAGQAPVGAPLVVDETVVVAGGTGGATGDAGAVASWSLPEGTLRWTADLGGPPAAPPSAAEGRVVVATRDGELVALDLATGRERWRGALRGPPVAAPALAGDAIVVPDHDGLSTWVDDGDAVREVARTRFVAPLERVPAVADGLIVLRGDSTRVVALDLTTHEVRWEAVTTSDVLTTPPTVVGDQVLVGGQVGVHGFALADGAPTPRVEIGPVVGAISATRTGVVVCRVDGALLVLR